MRVIVVQVAGIDALTAKQIARLQAQSEKHFVDAVKAIGTEIGIGQVHVTILEGPQQTTQPKPDR